MTELERELTKLEFKFKDNRKIQDGTRLEYFTDNSTDQDFSATNLMFDLKNKSKTDKFINED